MNKKHSDKDVIYKEIITGSYNPRRYSMKIIDGETPLVVLTSCYLLDFESQKTASYNLNKEGIDKIKERIENARYLFNDEPLEECDYFVLDGCKEEYFFRSGNKKAKIKKDNFSLIYSEMSKDTKAGEIMNIIDSIHEILKEYGIALDEPA